MYVSYSWDLPPLWSLSPRCAASGATPRTSRTLIDGRYTAFFSSPIDLDALYTCPSEVNSSVFRFPSLLIHVASLDSWNRLRTEGYGFADVPMKPGIHEIEISCWRPTGNSILDEMRRFFIGSSPEIEDFSYCRVPTVTHSRIVSKLGFRCQSTGTVKLRLNVLQQAGEMGGPSAELMKQLSGKEHAGFISSGANGVVANQWTGLSKLTALSQAVQTVLDGYHKAKEKLAAAREGLPGHVKAMMVLANSQQQQQQQSQQLSNRLAAATRMHALGKK